jgi:hypothetical protein
MATKSKKPMVKNEPADTTEAKKKATNVLRPSVNAAVVMDAFTGNTFGEIDLGLTIGELSASMSELNNGKLDCVENMLFGQAHALQAMFVNLARRGAKQEYLKQYETYLRLALKAQSQCRATLETLAAIKNPPVVYAKQANIANGPQQINNGTAAPSHAKENESQQTKLSGGNHELLTDTRTSQTASRVNQEVEAVESINRAKVVRG